MLGMMSAPGAKLMSGTAIERWSSVFRRYVGQHGAAAAALSLTVLLTACGGHQAAFLSEGDSDHSLTIERQQPYFGGPWEAAIVVAGMPQCQRRYHLQGFADEALHIDVYRPEPGVYILAVGQRWFVAELKQCGFQQYRQPPPEPGERVGSFEAKPDGALRYLPLPVAGKPAAAE
jgi:hypothetical protein